LHGGGGGGGGEIPSLSGLPPQQLHVSLNGGPTVTAYADGRGGSELKVGGGGGDGGLVTYRASLLSPRSSVAVSSARNSSSSSSGNYNNAWEKNNSAGGFPGKSSSAKFKGGGVTMNSLAPRPLGGNWDTSFSAAFPPAALPQITTTSINGDGVQIRTVTPARSGRGGGNFINVNTTNLHHSSKDGSDPLSHFKVGATSAGKDDPLAPFRSAPPPDATSRSGRGGGYLSYSGAAAGGKFASSPMALAPQNPRYKPTPSLPIAPSSIATGLGLDIWDA